MAVCLTGGYRTALCHQTGAYQTGEFRSPYPPGVFLMAWCRSPAYQQVVYLKAGLHSPAYRQVVYLRELRQRSRTMHRLPEPRRQTAAPG